MGLLERNLAVCQSLTDGTIAVSGRSPGVIRMGTWNGWSHAEARHVGRILCGANWIENGPAKDNAQRWPGMTVRCSLHLPDTHCKGIEPAEDVDAEVIVHVHRSDWGPCATEGMPGAMTHQHRKGSLRRPTGQQPPVSGDNWSSIQCLGLHFDRYASGRAYLIRAGRS